MNIRNGILAILAIGSIFSSPVIAGGLSEKEVETGLKIGFALTAGTLITGTTIITMATAGTIAGGIQGAMTAGPLGAIAGGALGCIGGGAAGGLTGLALTSALCYKLDGKKEEPKKA